jgi:hypothetical protein
MLGDDGGLNTALLVQLDNRLDGLPDSARDGGGNAFGENVSDNPADDLVVVKRGDDSAGWVTFAGKWRGRGRGRGRAACRSQAAAGPQSTR